jgi:hypothetical protein
VNVDGGSTTHVTRPPFFFFFFFFREHQKHIKQKSLSNSLSLLTLLKKELSDALTPPEGFRSKIKNSAAIFPCGKQPQVGNRYTNSKNN